MAIEISRISEAYNVLYSEEKSLLSYSKGPAALLLDRTIGQGQSDGLFTTATCGRRLFENLTSTDATVAEAANETSIAHQPQHPDAAADSDAD